VDAQCERESVRPNSQDVGLEAAIIERVRNSSLVECSGTENVSRLKHPTEAVESLYHEGIGRGAFLSSREARPEGLVERREVRMPE
jgi:hypothetical protein